MHKNRLFTIGFTKKKARDFFGLITKNNIKLLIDVRLNNVSQLAGFAKKDDLSYFLHEICDCDYEHRPDWAPTKEILDGYKKGEIDWLTYESAFIELLRKRRVERGVDVDRLCGAVLLCSESRPEKCHRRLVAEYLMSHLGVVEVKHI